MTELPKPSRPGSWAPAQTLTHLCCSHRQHHHKTLLQPIHVSAAVPLARTLTFRERTSGVSGEYILVLLPTAATGFRISLNHAMVPKCQVSRVRPHQQMGANAHAGELWHPGAPQGQGSSRLGRRCFTLPFFHSFVPTSTRHLTQVHGLPPYPPRTWCSNFFIISAHLRGRHVESLRYWVNFTGGQGSCSRRDLVQ